MGGNPDRLMLKKYDPATGEWTLPMTGVFWEAVRAARAAGQRGAGLTIAVVDDGFDLRFPALARQVLIWPDRNTSSDHGTVVALLILAVAPDATLLLYPVGGVEGYLDEDRIVRAIGDASKRHAQIINLSLGLRLAMPDFSDEELLEALVTGNWRAVLDHEDAMTHAAAVAAKKGATVIAAAGNGAESFWSPAIDPAVYATGFQAEVREISPDGGEEAAATPPSYSQSYGVDFTLIQPRHVVGSSFSNPLFSGFVALMRNRADLGAYRRAVAQSSMAAALQIGAKTRSGNALIVQLYECALAAAPHDHSELSTACPECQLFVADIYTNFGYFQLRHDLPAAEALLTAVVGFAPESPHAAANLGHVRGHQASERFGAGDRDSARRLYSEAAELMQRAFRLRLSLYPPYERRATEYAAWAAELEVPQTAPLSPEPTSGV